MKKSSKDTAPKAPIPEIEQPSVISPTTRAWNNLNPKMSKEFKKLMFEYLVNQYLYELMSPSLSGKDYGELVKAWEAEAIKCDILKVYPFEREIFQHTHPMAEDAKVEALRRKNRPQRNDCP